MTVTTEPEFYDVAMTDRDEPAMLPLEQSPWFQIYQQASWMIESSAPVVDLGCGTGRFAEQLRRRGVQTYDGLDFSPKAIDEARSYVDAPDYRFAVCDLREWDPGERWSTTVYTCLETLEHLEDDVAVVEKVPVGHEFIFSVPNFGGEAHLRVFQNATDAVHRYGQLLQFRAWLLIGDGPRNFVHLYRALRRPDSWR